MSCHLRILLSLSLTILTSVCSGPACSKLALGPHYRLSTVCTAPPPPPPSSLSTTHGRGRSLPPRTDHLVDDAHSHRQTTPSGYNTSPTVVPLLTILFSLFPPHEPFVRHSLLPWSR